MTISFFVAGDPKPQPRPRAFAFKGHARVYDAGTAEGWKSLIAVALKQTWKGAPIEGPIHLGLTFYMRRPKSHYNSKGIIKPAHLNEWHTQKPDVDNLAKAVMDCLTQCGVWRDDSQVCVQYVTKMWDSNQMPGCKITITPMADHDAQQQPHVAE